MKTKFFFFCGLFLMLAISACNEKTGDLKSLSSGVDGVSFTTEYKAYYLELTLQNSLPDSVDSTGADVDTVWVLYPPFYDTRAWRPSTTRPTWNIEQIGEAWYN